VHVRKIITVMYGVMYDVMYGVVAAQSSVIILSSTELQLVGGRCVTGRPSSLTAVRVHRACLTTERYEVFSDILYGTTL